MDLESAFNKKNEKLPVDIKPGKVMRKEEYDEAVRQLTPEPLVRAPHGWWIIVHPDTPEHRDLAGKLAGKKPGELVPLTLNEMARLVEFQVWPMQLPPTASF